MIIPWITKNPNTKNGKFDNDNYSHHQHCYNSTTRSFIIIIFYLKIHQIAAGYIK